MRHLIYSEMMNGLIIERCTRDQEYNMIKHWHPEVEFQFFIRGKRKFFVDNENYVCSEGSLIVIDSEQVHNTYSHKELFHERILLSFEKDKFEQILSVMGLDLNHFFLHHRGLIQIPEEDREYVENLLGDIAEEVHKKQPNYQLVVHLRLAEFLIYLERMQHKGKKERQSGGTHSHELNQTVNQVTSYIRAHYKEVHSLDELAQAFYLNKSYLSRIFKKATGYTVTEYINIYRIQESQKLLEDTDMSIADVAQAVGYENMTYYNRVFKKYVETSPLQYRKKQIAYKQGLREKNYN